VNLEADLIGKYVEKFLNLQGLVQEPSRGIEKEFLAKHGFYTPEEG
jgi:hypothetical protein